MTAYPGVGGSENCMLQEGETNLLLSTGAHLSDSPRFTGALYFETSGVREFYGRIKDEVEIVWPLESMDYGTLGIRDRDGHTLAFAEEQSDS